MKNGCGNYYVFCRKAKKAGVRRLALFLIQNCSYVESEHKGFMGSIQ
jgi:hypothetical protein